MKVIIAEKPSVAKNISEALGVKSRKDGYFEGNGYYITWAFGHLLQLYDAKDYNEKMKSWRMEMFPFIPEQFRYKVKQDSSNKSITDAGAKKQIGIISGLINRDDVDAVISATDFDREGQVIADEIFDYLEVKKPIYRLLLNEWTPTEVKKGIENLKPNTDMKPLKDAGISRQWADWTIGINLTSVATLRYKFGDDDKKIINIGRVLLPTLKIIYDRDKEIENFKESVYYKLVANCKTKKNEEFESLYYENDSEKFLDNTYLNNLSKELKGTSLKIVDKQSEKKRENPPYLFNLSGLQGYVTSKYKGWTSDKVLKVAQSLYEKKHITYPRTASVVLDESLKDKVRNVLNTIKKNLPYADSVRFKEDKRIFNSKKVESHSAIIPTYMIPSSLSADEKIVYEAVKNRFIMQFMDSAEFEETKITLVPDNREIVKGVFISKGRIMLREGYRIVEKIETKDTILPMVAVGDYVDIVETKANKVTKKPPKLHNEKTLLRLMETCGKSFNSDEEESDEMMESILSGFSIGTPATRAETIKKLKDTGYITMKGKNLTCTPLGRDIVENFPVPELFNLDYTGRLEKTLSDIEKNKVEKKAFLDLINNFTRSSVEKVKNDISMLDKVKVKLPEGVEEIGKCPICGNPVVETEKSFGCSNWKNGCKFTIWKNDKFIQSFGKQVTRPMVELLLKNGKVGFHKLRSKNGNLFSAYFLYSRDEETGRFSWKLEFIDNN